MRQHGRQTDCVYSSPEVPVADLQGCSKVDNVQTNPMTYVTMAAIVHHTRVGSAAVSLSKLCNPDPENDPSRTLRAVAIEARR